MALAWQEAEGSLLDSFCSDLWPHVWHFPFFSVFGFSRKKHFVVKSEGLQLKPTSFALGLRANVERDYWQEREGEAEPVRALSRSGDRRGHCSFHFTTNHITVCHHS